MKLPSVSLVICTHNGAGRLAKAIEAVLSQRLPSDFELELIIVDNASTDGTADAARELLSKVERMAWKVVREDRPGIAYARMRGIHSSSNEIICFVDDDNWIDPDFVWQASSLMEAHAEAGVSGGYNRPRLESPAPEWFDSVQEAYGAGYQGDGGDITLTRGYVWGAGMVLRRAAWNELEQKLSGLFPLCPGRQQSHLAAGDDTELCRALKYLGWKIWSEPGLRLTHVIAQSRLNVAYLRQLYRGFGASKVGLDLYTFAAARFLVCDRKPRGAWLFQCMRNGLRLMGSTLRLALPGGGLTRQLRWIHDAAWCAEHLRWAGKYNDALFQLQKRLFDRGGLPSQNKVFQGLSSGKSSRFWSSVRMNSSEFDLLCRMRIKNRIKLNQPLVLISQAPRSGGTLLSQLLEGHPQCLAHPGELVLSRPDKAIWPRLGLNAGPDAWYDALFDLNFLKHFKNGFTKNPRGDRGPGDLFPFLLVPSLQRELFMQWVQDGPILKQRDILNAYFSSLFNAWLDCQGIYSRKKYITAFAAGLSLIPESVEGYFRDYPDGRMISIVREPKSWFLSYRRLAGEDRRDIESSLLRHRQSLERLLENRKKYNTRVHLVLFEDLLNRTAEVMQGISHFLQIDFCGTMLEPTFQGMSIRANSAFTVRREGVLSEPLSRWQWLLTESEISRIDKIDNGLYASIAQQIGLPERSCPAQFAAPA